MTPAPPVGFNLTFACPQGQVFASDWLAIPFVMMTCQVGEPKSWANFLNYENFKIYDILNCLASFYMYFNTN